MGSGKFTKKYEGKNKYQAMKERIDFWLKKHGKNKTIKIMLDQGIITKNGMDKTKRRLGLS